MSLFDDVDVQYLADNFAPEQLRWEIHMANVRQTVANAWVGTDYEHPQDCFPHAECATACREAIQLIQSKKPKPKSARGRIDIEQVKTATDIVEVIECYTKLRKAGRNFVGCCPIHVEKHPSLTIYPDEQRWWCYGCNQGGDVIDFVKVMKSTDFKGAVTILGLR